MGPVSIFLKIEFLSNYVRRLKTERQAFRQRIEAEGGSIRSVCRVGMMFKNPFPPMRSFPLYHWFDVRYGSRSGAWFAATDEDRPDGFWIWKDADGLPSLPVNRTDDSRVENKVLALSFFASIALPYSIFIGLVCLLIWWVRSTM